MAPKGAPTTINPIRLQTVTRLKIKRPDKQEPNPCLGPMSAMLSLSPIASPSELHLSFHFCVRLPSHSQAAGHPPATVSLAAQASNKHFANAWMRPKPPQNPRAPSITTWRGYIRISRDLRRGRGAWEVQDERSCTRRWLYLLLFKADCSV